MESIENLYSRYATGKNIKRVLFYFIYIVIPPQGNIKSVRWHISDAKSHAHYDHNLCNLIVQNDVLRISQVNHKYLESARKIS
jgi:hypothetical protein